MSYMRDSDGVRLDDYPLAALTDGRTFARDPARFTVATDTATVTLNASGDASYNRAYPRGVGAVPATFPIDFGSSTEYLNAGNSYQALPSLNNVRPLRFVCDHSSIALLVAAIAGQGMTIFVNGRPLSLSPFVFTVTGGQYFTIVFAGAAEPRLIEIYTNVGVNTIYTKKPGKIWKPAPVARPKVIVQGDSYVEGYITSNTGSTVVSDLTRGIYQGMAPWLGLDEILLNGTGGTGYLRESGGVGDNNYYQRRQQVIDTNPDMVVVHGGGANDLFYGFTVSDIVNQAILHFTALRAGLPHAKLVFVEGFAPPNPVFAAFNPSYVSIRTQLQAALTDVGVYYVDVATTQPWINGLGYVTAPNADGENSSTYIGFDAIHPTVLGCQMIQGRFASKYRKVLRDRGTLVNTLI